MNNVFKIVGRGIVKSAIWIYCKIVYRFEVIGKENIPKEGAAIICGNHRTYLDPPLIEVTCGRYARFLAKEELTKNKFFAILGDKKWLRKRRKSERWCCFFCIEKWSSCYSLWD